MRLCYLTDDIQLMNCGVISRSEGEDTKGTLPRTKTTSVWVNLHNLTQHINAHQREKENKIMACTTMNTSRVCVIRDSQTEPHKEGGSMFFWLPLYLPLPAGWCVGAGPIHSGRCLRKTRW